jgi:hypothetical protein
MIHSSKNAAAMACIQPSMWLASFRSPRQPDEGFVR